MSYENKGKTITLIANADYSDRYIAVKKTAVDEEFAVCGAGDVPVGILQFDVPKGKAGTVMTDGVSFVKAGGAIAAGASVTTDVGGVAVTAIEDDVPFGITLNAASAAGDIVSVLLKTAGNPTGPLEPAAVFLQYTSTDLAAGADITADILGVIPNDSKLKSAKVVSTGSASGIDAANTSAFEVKVGATVLASKTFNDTVAFPGANESVDLTLGAEVSLEENDVVTLSVTNGSTADLPIFVVQLEIV